MKVTEFPASLVSGSEVEFFMSKNNFERIQEF
jgi:hypothetical protein